MLNQVKAAGAFLALFLLLSVPCFAPYILISAVNSKAGDIFLYISIPLFGIFMHRWLTPWFRFFGVKE